MFAKKIWIPLLSVWVLTMGCSLFDEFLSEEVDYGGPLGICLVSFSKERPAKVLMRITGPIEGVDATFSNVYTDRDENTIFLRPTIPSDLYPERGDVISEGFGTLYGEVTVTDLDVGEYTIVFRYSGKYDTMVYNYPSYFLRVEAETVYFFTKTDNKTHNCLGGW